MDAATLVVGFGGLLAGLSVALYAKRPAAPRRPSAPLVLHVPPAEGAPPGPERFRITETTGDCIHERYRGEQGGSAARMWGTLIADKKNHPGTLEFWDGPHRRSVHP